MNEELKTQLQEISDLLDKAMQEAPSRNVADASNKLSELLETEG
jgi:hypothetical protein